MNENGHRVIPASLEMRTDDIENTMMADDCISPPETLRMVSDTGEVDVLREGVRLLALVGVETEVTELTGVPKDERDPEQRLDPQQRGSRAMLDIRVGTMGLDVPWVRDGGYLPFLREPRRRAERPLLAVVQQAYVSGVFTRRVDDLARALRIEGINKIEVSWSSAAADAEVEAFLSRPLGELTIPTSGSTRPERDGGP